MLDLYEASFNVKYLQSLELNPLTNHLLSRTDPDYKIMHFVGSSERMAIFVDVNWQAFLLPLTEL